MSAAAGTDRPATRDARTFLRDRLASLLAVVPLSIWTANHLWNNLSVFQGAAAWQSSVTEYGHPVAFLATSIVALLPLVLHTVWGVSRLFSARPNNTKYKFFGNIRYALQRLSAIGVLAFLGAHLWLAFLHPRITTGKPEPFAHIAHEMHHHLPTLAVYVLGTLGVTYHLANGLHSFAMGWGIVTSRRSLNRLEFGVVATFLVLLAMGWGAIYGLWDAGT